jgi:hypothetical protein
MAWPETAHIRLDPTLSGTAHVSAAALSLLLQTTGKLLEEFPVPRFDFLQAQVVWTCRT